MGRCEACHGMRARLASAALVAFWLMVLFIGWSQPNRNLFMGPTIAVFASCVFLWRFPIARRVMVSLILFSFCGFFMCLSTSIAWQRHPSGQTPLPDIFHDHFETVNSVTLPLIGTTFGGVEFTEMLMSIVTVSTLAFMFLQPWRWLLIRRILVIYATLAFIRFITVLTTNLPDSRPECHALTTGKRGFGEIDWGNALNMTFRLMLPVGNVTCGDMVFSGHSMLLVVCGMTWHAYYRVQPGTYSINWVKCLMWTLVGTALTLVILTRLHYTLDVFLAVYLTVTVWGSYHRMADDVIIGHRFHSVWVVDALVIYPFLEWFEAPHLGEARRGIAAILLEERRSRLAAASGNGTSSAGASAASASSSSLSLASASSSSLSASSSASDATTTALAEPSLRIRAQPSSTSLSTSLSSSSSSSSSPSIRASQAAGDGPVLSSGATGDEDDGSAGLSTPLVSLASGAWLRLSEDLSGIGRSLRRAIRRALRHGGVLSRIGHGSWLLTRANSAHTAVVEEGQTVIESSELDGPTAADAHASSHSHGRGGSGGGSGSGSHGSHGGHGSHGHRGGRNRSRGSSAVDDITDGVNGTGLLATEKTVGGAGAGAGAGVGAGAVGSGSGVEEVSFPGGTVESLIHLVRSRTSTDGESVVTRSVRSRARSSSSVSDANPTPLPSSSAHGGLVPSVVDLGVTGVTVPPGLLGRDPVMDDARGAWIQRGARMERAGGRHKDGVQGGTNEPRESEDGEAGRNGGGGVRGDGHPNRGEKEREEKEDEEEDGEEDDDDDDDDDDDEDDGEDHWSLGSEDEMLLNEIGGEVYVRALVGAGGGFGRAMAPYQGASRLAASRTAVTPVRTPAPAPLATEQRARTPRTSSSSSAAMTAETTPLPLPASTTTSRRRGGAHGAGAEELHTPASASAGGRRGGGGNERSDFGPRSRSRTPTRSGRRG